MISQLLGPLRRPYCFIKSDSNLRRQRAQVSFKTRKWELLEENVVENILALYPMTDLFSGAQ